MSPEQMASIRQKAEVLYGMSLGENGDLLVRIAVDQALAHCNRRDIPAEMEQAIAVVAVFLAGGGERIKSLTRGDTAITYATDDGSWAPLAALAPWRRLGAVKREEAVET